MSGPCDWPIVYTGCSGTSVIDQLDPADRDLIELAATELLWRWTHRAFGVCTLVIRPTVLCSRPATYWGYGPYTSGSSASWSTGPLARSAWLGSGGYLVNLACGCCGTGSCSCSTLTVVKLPGPVVAVNSVTIDGVDFPEAGNWSLDNDRLLRTDGQAWPTSQNLELPDTELCTWSIAYDWGRTVPAGGQLAAGILAVELAKASCGDSSCQLPQRVRSITRQGISMAVLDGFDDLDKGRTGIWMVDSWVSSIINPPMPSTVRSVDLPATLLRRPPVVAP